MLSLQVLGSVKHKVDCYSYTVKDFESLMLKARRFLAWREEIYFGDHDHPGRGERSNSVMSVPAVKTVKGMIFVHLQTVSLRCISPMSAFACLSVHNVMNRF